MDEHLHQRLIFDELNVSSSTDDSIKISFWNVEVDIHAEDTLDVHWRPDIFDHSRIDGPQLRVCICYTSGLNAGGLIRSVLVLVTGDEHYVLEMLEARGLLGDTGNNALDQGHPSVTTVPSI